VFDMSDDPARELPRPPWHRTPDRGRGHHRQPITQQAVVAAAIKVLDQRGLDGLSMRNVGEILGTGAASLYWHVGSKDGLLDLILDAVIGEQHVPDPEPPRWQEQIKEVARTMRRTILAHRDIVRISIGRIPMGPNALHYSERVLAILRAGGVPNHLAVVGFHLLTAVVNGFTMDETGEGGQPPADMPPSEEIGRMARDYLASLPPERFPNLTQLADQLAITDPDRRFELLLDIYVEGLARAGAVNSTV
jgi:AcrR family transcriptional regulator